MRKKIINGKEYIFDIVRKKFIRNQPEEWVRQHVILYLNQKKGYPLSLMSIEKKSELNSIKKRTDIICSDKNGKPLLLIECKANHIQLNNKTIDQSIIYQQKINAKLIVITNGKTHYCFKKESDKITFLKHIPHYNQFRSK